MSTRKLVWESIRSSHSTSLICSARNRPDQAFAVLGLANAVLFHGHPTPHRPTKPWPSAFHVPRRDENGLFLFRPSCSLLRVASNPGALPAAVAGIPPAHSNCRVARPACEHPIGVGIHWLAGRHVQRSLVRIAIRLEATPSFPYGFLR